jgi:hypothetical protein
LALPGIAGDAAARTVCWRQALKETVNWSDSAKRHLVATGSMVELGGPMASLRLLWLRACKGCRLSEC